MRVWKRCHKDFAFVLVGILRSRARWKQSPPEIVGAWKRGCNPLRLQAMEYAGRLALALYPPHVRRYYGCTSKGNSRTEKRSRVRMKAIAA